MHGLMLALYRQDQQTGLYEWANQSTSRIIQLKKLLFYFQ
jgi:hypothetical protein